MAKKDETEWNGPPPPDVQRGQRSPYPFKTWEVGDTERYPLSEYKKIRNAVDNLNRPKQGRWRYAQVEEDGAKWVRVWRVE